VIGRRARKGLASDAAATVDFHRDPRDHACLVGAQESSGVAHVFGRGEAADWNRRQEFCAPRADFGSSGERAEPGGLSVVPEPIPGRRRQIVVLRGDIPNPIEPPSGCRFRTRCPLAQQVCAEREPQLMPKSDGAGEHLVACHLA